MKKMKWKIYLLKYLQTSKNTSQIFNCISSDFIDYILKNEISFFFSFWLNNVERRIIRWKSENIECIKTEGIFINLEYLCMYILIHPCIHMYRIYIYTIYSHIYSYMYMCMNIFIYMYIFLYIHILWNRYYKNWIIVFPLVSSLILWTLFYDCNYWLYIIISKSYMVFC